VVGAAFGFVLGWARVTDHDVIRNMLLLREPDVFLIMMSAIATAALGVRALRALKARAIVDDSPVNWKVEPPAKRHIGGSVLFGLGWSIAATCPGPVAAQLGRGQFAGLFTVAGLFIGILVCDRLRTPSTAPEVPMSDDATTAVGL